MPLKTKMPVHNQIPQESKYSYCVDAAFDLLTLNQILQASWSGSMPICCNSFLSYTAWSVPIYFVVVSGFQNTSFSQTLQACFLGTNVEFNGICFLGHVLMIAAFLARNIKTEMCIKSYSAHVFSPPPPFSLFHWIKSYLDYTCCRNSERILPHLSSTAAKFAFSSTAMNPILKFLFLQKSPNFT